MSNGNKKSLGPDHYFSQYGGERPIPEPFVAAMERTEERRSVPKDYELPISTPEIVEARFEPGDRRTNEKLLIVIRKKTGNITLRDIRTNDQGQPVQVTQTLFPTGTTPTEPTATTNVAVQDLGNGWSIQEVGVEGTYVDGVFTPGVFAANVFERERPNLVPEEFRPTIPTVTTRIDSAGTAVDPTLSGTELSERQEQLNEFKKRITISTQAAPSLPVTRDKGRDTNQVKQDVTVTRKLIADGTTADVATALKDVSVKQLGDGNKVQETREVAEVFPRTTERLAIPNIIPERFKASIPVFTRSEDDAGTQTAVTSLNNGEFERTVERLTEFTRRITNTYLDLETLPITQTDTAVDKEGVTTSVVFTIAYGAQTISAATNLSSAELSDLGVGLTLKTEIFDTLPGPTLTKTDFDKDGILKTTTRRKMLAASVVTSEDLTLGVFTRKSKEPVNSTIAYQIIETITVDDANLLDLPSFTTSIPNVIPELFRALIATHVESHIVEGTASETTLDTGEFEHSERQLTPLYMEVRSTVLDDIDSLPITVSGMKETNAQKQVVTVAMKLCLDSTMPTVPTTLIDVDFKKLGNGLAVEITKTIPSVFAASEFADKSPSYPSEYVTDEATIASDTAGTASAPTAPAGGSATQQQIDNFVKRTTTTTPTTASPLTEVETNQSKQKVTVVRTLGGTAGSPSATVDVEQRVLPGGRTEGVTKTVESVFAKDVFTSEIPGAPNEFKTGESRHSVDSSGNAAAPTASGDDIAKTSEQVNAFVKRDSTTTQTKVTSRTEKDTNQAKQEVTVVKTLGSSGGSPSATKDVIDRYVDGQLVGEARTVGAVFNANEFTDKSASYPSEYVTHETTVESNTAATASAPTAPAGGSATQQQVNDFVTRTSTTTPTTASPVTEVVTNAQKQKVTIVRTLGGTAGTPTALVDVEQRVLPGGRTESVTKTVASVFDKDTRSIEIPDVTPPWARSLLATTNTSIETAATTVSDPTLLTGQLRKQVQRKSEFTIQTDVTARDAASLPKTRTNKRLTTEFGGGVVDQVETIATGSQSISSGGLLVLDSEMEVLGDGTSALKTSTQTDGSWPVLSDYDIDEETGQTILTTYQVVAAGTAATATIASGVVTRYKHIDKWRSLKIVATLSTPASYEEQRFGAFTFPALFAGSSTYYWTSECGAFISDGGLRSSFAALVPHRVVISFATSRPATIDGLTLIPQTLVLGKGVQLPQDIICDADEFIYTGTCSGTVDFGGSDPDYSTYTGGIQGTEQLITGESVKTKAGLYRTTEVYVTMK